MPEPRISALALHYVGNQANDEPFVLSRKLFAMTEDMNTLLSDYFVGAFKSEERFHFHDDTGLENNRVYRLVSDIFDNPDMVYDFSVDLATHLYENCQHPKIKGGDFYVAYITGLGVGAEQCDAIGLFKIENKDTFLTVEHEDDVFDMSTVQGVSLKKLDKGCLIYNSEREKGYYVAVVDKTNSQEAAYWVDDYLHKAGAQGGFVMDGRDIGTTVFTNADLKIFMTASKEVRAQRRMDEMLAKGESVTFEEVLKNLEERDYIDSHRETSPLKRAEDAFVLDNSDMNLHEEVVWMRGLIMGRFGILE